MNKPYYKRTEGIEKGTYIRLGRNTMHATMDMIEELKWQSRGRSYEMMPVYNASKEDIDYQKIQSFLKKRKKVSDAQINDALLENYSIIVSEHGKPYPSLLGMLLFGHEPAKYFPEAMILCSHFSGIQGRDAIANRDCYGTLFEQFHAAYDFILGRLNYSFKIESAVREEEFEIPAIAIREALLNAIIHRNYHVNAPIKIAIFDNRIEFNSPGSFAGPIDTNDISLGISYLRNSMICRIFREAGYIEKLGSGLPTIFLNYKKYSLTEPTIYENGNYVKCILPRTKISPELMGIKDEELVDILKLFSLTSELSISDVMVHFSLTRATAGRRLNSLVENGLIERIGKGKNIRYALVKKDH